MKAKLFSVFMVVCLAVSFFAVYPVDAEAPWLSGYSPSDTGRRILFYWQSSGAGQWNFNVVNATNFNTANTFYINNETRSDYADLNVTKVDGTPLAMWNQTTHIGSNITVWVNFPAANASYYLYWGNPNATVGWNQTTVFNDVISVVGAWTMNVASASNSVTDYSGNSNSGTSTNVTLSSSKFSGENAITTDGLTAKVSMGNPTALNFTTENFSVDGWIKTTSVSSYIVAKRGSAIGWWIGYHYDYIRDATSGSLQTSPAYAYNDGNWHHIVYSRNSGTLV